jgi:hypothetical protein
MSDVTPPVPPAEPAPQPAPGAPVPPPAPASRRGNPIALIGFIIAIVAFVFAVIPVISFIAWLPAVVAIVLCIIGLASKGRPKVFAAIGLPVAIVAIIVGIIVSVVTGLAAVGTAVNEVQKTASAKAAEPLTVVYSVTSDQPTVSVTYSNYSNGSSGLEQAQGTPAPFTKELDLTRGSDFDFKSFTLTGSLNQTGGTVTCTITVNGKQVSTQTSSGVFSSATCSASGSDLGK